MSSSLLKLYHHLPSPARSLVASARGLYLRSWRYGPQFERMVEEILERETWSREQWQRWQQDRLAQVLERAATQVPYYREQWAQRRKQGDQSSWRELSNWPILEKEALRENAPAFVADDCDRRRMMHEHTSGTTGKSLDLWRSRETTQALYALSEARERRWHGVSSHDRWAIIGGQLVVPVAQRKPPFWVWNGALNQLYMSSYHLAPDLMPAYLDALRHYRIRYLFGYTSALYALAQEALRRPQNDWRMTVAICNAEPVFDYQRQTIFRAFGCPVRETYGNSEGVAMATECSAGRLHLWPEAGWVEVIEDDQSVPAGQTGDLICTGLLNPDMPLIRYRIGDRGALAERSLVCECGRAMPMLDRVEGRSDDVLYTADGRRIGRLDPVFKAHLPVLEAQVVQETLGRVRVLYVPAPQFSAADGASIVERLRERMGDIEVVLEAVDEVPRTSRGKFRAVVCRLSDEERRAVESAAVEVTP